jgi:hypothetical protein
LNGGNWRIIAEFTEVESEKRSDRPALDKALAAARAFIKCRWWWPRLLARNSISRSCCS